jgi:site-specific DNA recombinase
MATFFATRRQFGMARRLSRLITLVAYVGLILAILAHYLRLGANPCGCRVAPFTVVSNGRRKCRRQPAEAAASYSRYSSDLQNESSIETQQERCREAAARDGKTISPELEFADRAVSGTMLDREGLNALLAAAEAGKFDTLYFYSLSRLARESVIALPILKRLVHVLRIRVVSQSEGLDTSRPDWETIAQIFSIQHEKYVRDLSDNVLRGQDFAVRSGRSVGDYCFGYTSVPVPGSENTRRRRNERVPMAYAIDEEAAPWVERIFSWFVRDRRPLRWIVRELNRLGAPKDHRATKKEWHHQYLTKLLGNPKYVGKWSWGRMKNVRDPGTGIKTQEERPVHETEKWDRDMPHLRIIDDETFAAAQVLLRENAVRHAHRHGDDGQFNGNQEGSAAANPRHILSGLIKCGHCGRTFHVTGAYNKYLFCPGYGKGVCPCQTTLNRQLAESLILAEVSKRILENPAWLEAVLESTRAAWAEQQRTLPNELRDTENRLAEVNRRISRLVDSVETADHADPDLQTRLSERRADRRELEDQLVRLRAGANKLPVEPTAAWVHEKLNNLQAVLTGGTPAAAFALRDLVGGQIVVEEIRKEGAKRHLLRGTFQMRRSRTMALLDLPALPENDADSSDLEVVTIDFIHPNPLDAEANEAKRLVDLKLSNKQIAAELHCCEAKVTGLLKHWSQIHGIELADGFTRRSQRRKNEMEAAMYRDIAEDAMRLLGQGMLRKEIAQSLKCNMATITKAIKWWHESRGLPVPDGRANRPEVQPKSLEDGEGKSSGEKSSAA